MIFNQIKYFGHNNLTLDFRFYKKTDSVMGYGKDASYKIPIHPLVTVAGDLAHLGLGKLIMLTH
ncbi:MAG: hypothetical protein ACI88H_001291, partial [Cocleimonas sp.]